MVRHGENMRTMLGKRGNLKTSCRRMCSDYQGTQRKYCNGKSKRKNGEMTGKSGKEEEKKSMRSREFKNSSPESDIWQNSFLKISIRRLIFFLG